MANAMTRRETLKRGLAAAGALALIIILGLARGEDFDEHFALARFGRGHLDDLERLGATESGVLHCVRHVAPPPASSAPVIVPLLGEKRQGWAWCGGPPTA